MAETITNQNVADAVLEYSCLFGANKNVYRIAASLNDGLKPGRRRLYWSWWLNEKKPKDTSKETLKKLRSIKAGTLSSNAMAFHPHGDTAMAELIVREGQYWNNNVMAIVPQGSYGNIRGDQAAAGRYAEAKIGEYMIDCFFDDFDKYCVPMKLAYDGETLEPEYLPAKYPHILFNPQFSGIGYGMASNIPPFNVAEVLKATIKLMKEPDTKIMLVPDSPTGADILDEGNFKEINKTGKSKITMRATSEIDYQNNIITFTSLPLQMTTKQVISRIIALKLDTIYDIKDYTKEGEVKLQILLKSDANPDKVLKTLYKKNTGLKMTFPVGITVIDDYAAYEYGVKDLLLEWIEYRRDIVRSMFLNNLQIVQEKLHMNKVLLMVFNKDNIEETIKIAKNSTSRKDTIEKLQKRYKITSLQASTIADMHVYNFNAESYNRYKADKISLDEELKEIKETLAHSSKIDDFIISQLERGIKKWGRPRMSKIVKENNKDEDSIPDTEHLIGISESGYIKKLSLDKNTSIGLVGKENGNLTVMQINNREDILVVDSSGRVSKISVSAIPDMKFDDNGIEISRYFSTNGKIIAVMKLPSMDVLKSKDDSLCIIFVTKNGLAKKVPISEFKKITDYKNGILLNDGDEVASALFSFDKSSKDVIICTNLGDGIRLAIKDIKTLGKQAKGVNQINLKDGEYVVNACKINPNKKLLFYVTSSGRVKLTDIKYFPAMQRKDDTLSLISLEKSETLIGVSSVGKNDIAMIYRKNGDPVQIELKNIKVSTRIAKGEKMVKTPKGDKVIAYKIFG
jgi:DNA gyrase subunit A